MLKEAKAETRKMRDSAHARTQDLKMQIDALKDINVKYQNKSLATTTELETSQQSMKFDGKMLEEKLESTRTRTESTKKQFDHTAENVRQAQSHLIQAREAIAACEEEEKAQADEIKSVHASVADKDREFHHIFQSEKASEDFVRGLQRDHADETHHLQVVMCWLAICKMSHHP
jgi:predicted transcriptional regulator